MSMDDAVALFQRFDLNGNGTLGFDELREFPGDQLTSRAFEVQIAIFIYHGKPYIILHHFTLSYIVLYHLAIFMVL